MITLENADKALKDYYLQAVTAQLNDNISPFFSAIEKTTNNVYGKDVKVSVVRGNTESVMACSEDSDLPAPYKNRYLELTAPLKNIYGTIEVSDKAMRASRDSSGAFVNLVNAEMEGLISSAKFNFQRMLYGDSTGALCTILAADSNAATNFKYTLSELKYLSVGKRVDAVTSDGVKTEGLTVTAINYATRVVTFDKAISGTAKGGVITLPGAYGNELTGLNAIFNASKLYGHDKSEEEYVSPYVVSASGAVTELSFIDVINYLEETYNSKVNMILCPYHIKKELSALFASMRYTINSIDTQAGHGAITINGIPVYADRFCPENTVYFLNTDDFALNQLCDWEWLEDEDGKILKQVPGKAAYSATLVKYAELICKKPYAQGVMVYQ